MIGDVRAIERPAPSVVQIPLTQPVPEADQRRNREQPRQLVPAEATVERLGGIRQER